MKPRIQPFLNRPHLTYPWLQWPIKLGRPKNPSTSSGGGSTVNAAYLTTEGAFNGSGIAIASQSYGTGGYGTIVLYFQYHDGTVRNMQLLTGGGWIGGDYSTIVANDAKNATPISAVSYAMDQISTVGGFHINNHVRLTYCSGTSFTSTGTI